MRGLHGAALTSARTTTGTKSSRWRLSGKMASPDKQRKGRKRGRVFIIEFHALISNQTEYINDTSIVGGAGEPQLNRYGLSRGPKVLLSIARMPSGFWVLALGTLIIEIKIR
jgi:hypothetical protein